MHGKLGTTELVKEVKGVYLIPKHSISYLSIAISYEKNIININSCSVVTEFVALWWQNLLLLWWAFSVDTPSTAGFCVNGRVSSGDFTISGETGHLINHWCQGWKVFNITEPNKILLPPMHIMLERAKNFVKVIDKGGQVFSHLTSNSSSLRRLTRFYWYSDLKAS